MHFFYKINILYKKTNTGGKKHMGQKGMDFKHKEVINIRDGKKDWDLFKMYAQIWKQGQLHQ